jgi:hypothetical protein
MSDEVDKDGTTSIPWAVFGKVSAVLGTLAVLWGLWTGFNAPRGDLVGVVQYSPFEIPPVLSELAEKTAREQQVEIKEELIKMSCDVSSNWRLQQIKDNPEYLAAKQKQGLGTATMFLADGVANVKVTNQGDATLRSVRLISDRPVRSGLILRPDKASESVLSSGGTALMAATGPMALTGNNFLFDTIELGDMPALSSVRVVLFVSDPLFGKYDVKLVHESGTGRTMTPEDIRTRRMILSLLPAAFLLVVLIVLIVQTQRKRPKQKPV